MSRQPNPKTDFFFDATSRWQRAIKLLRNIALDCGLTEELKWGRPCYTYEGKNIVLIHSFKEYCAYLFFKGALINDVSNILIQQTQNVQSARQARFTTTQEIVALKDTLKAYIYEAIEIEKAGLKVELKKTQDYDVPKEFQEQLDAIPELKKAFKTLTPGRQRAYLFYFSQAKQSKTRMARVEKYIPQILKGKGLND